jgi:RNA-binding protein 5/10
VSLLGFNSPTLNHSFPAFQSAGRLLGAIMSPDLHPEGFRISNRPVAASFGSTVSFQPLAPHSLRDEACIMGSSAMGGAEGVFAKYWDESTIVLEMAFEVAQPAAKKDSTMQGEKKKKKKNKDDDASGYPTPHAAQAHLHYSVISVDINEFMNSAIKPEIKVSTTMPTNLKPLTFNMKGSSSSQVKLAGNLRPVGNSLKPT